MSIFNILGRGWKLFRAQFGAVLFFATLLVIACQAVSAGAQNVVALILSFVGFYFHLGLNNMSLQIAKGGKAEFSDLLVDGKVFLNYLLAVFTIFIVLVLVYILGFFIVVGLVELFKSVQTFIIFFSAFLGVVFGYWVMVRCFLLLPYIILERGLSPLEAIKASFKMTEGYGAVLFGFLIIATLLYFVGAILLFVGLLVAIPWVLISQALIYEELKR